MGSVSITAFGAKGDGRTDNKAAIQKTIDHAKANGLDVHVPEGTFLHKGILRLDGVDMYGAGSSSVLKAIGASSTFDDQAIRITGNGASLKNLTLDSDAGSRGYTGDSAKVWVVGATNFVIDNVAVKNSFGAGFLIGGGSSYGKVTNNKLTGTNADSIHFYQGSHHMTVTGNRVENSGDDGIAVVSYANNSTATHDIEIAGNTILNNQWGRNISVVGGYNVNIARNTVDGNKAGLAGVYIAAEGSYNTYGVKNVNVADNIIRNVGGYNTGHGAVMIYNGTTSKVVEDVNVRHNQIVNAVKNGIFIRGSRIDDIRLEDNLIEKAGSAPVAVSGGATDVIQIDNTTSRTAWLSSASPADSETGAPAPTEPPANPDTGNAGGDGDTGTPSPEPAPTPTPDPSPAPEPPPAPTPPPTPDPTPEPPVPSEPTAPSGNDNGPATPPEDPEPAPVYLGPPEEEVSSPFGSGRAEEEVSVAPPVNDGPTDKPVETLAFMAEAAWDDGAGKSDIPQEALPAAVAPETPVADWPVDGLAEIAVLTGIPLSEYAF